LGRAQAKELQRQEQEQRKLEQFAKLAELEAKTAMGRRYSKEQTFNEQRRATTASPEAGRRLSKGQLKDNRASDGVWKPSKELLEKQGRPVSQPAPKRRMSKDQILWQNQMWANLEAASRHGLRNLEKMRGEVCASARLAKSRASTPADLDIIRKEMGIEVEKPGDGKATRLAMMYKLDLSEVKYALKQFEEADVNRSGGLDRDEFRIAMANILGRQPFELNPETVQSAWDKVSGHGGKGTTMDEMSVEKFFEWYIINMFQSVREERATDEDKEVYAIAERFGAPPPVIDKLRAEFKRFDTDGSGAIEYEEFAQMMYTLLKCKNDGDMSEDRLQRFWAEIDGDGSGEADFTEFCEFYLKYFMSELSSVSRDGGIVGQFYASFNPQVTRRRSKEKAVDAEVAAGLSLGFGNARERVAEDNARALGRRVTIA
jgi:Ca2+-binding EF-hand superfamily protein